MNGYADLHLHTVASDGTRTIDEVVVRARECGLSCIAITDHDVIAQELTERVHVELGVEVITGVEIKATFGDVAGEILGYFVDPEADALRRLLDGLKASRVERMHRMVDLCSEHVGVGITYEEVRTVGPGNIGRPHLARVLIDRGVVDSFEEAFGDWLAKDKPCYWPIDKPDYQDVLDAVHEAGGVTGGGQGAACGSGRGHLADCRRQGRDHLPHRRLAPGAGRSREGAPPQAPRSLGSSAPASPPDRCEIGLQLGHKRTRAPQLGGQRLVV